MKPYFQPLRASHLPEGESPNFDDSGTRKIHSHLFPAANTGLAHVMELPDEVIAARKEQGLTIDASFVGVREVTLQDATFDRKTSEGEVTVKFVGELTSVVKNAEGEIVEGDATEIKRQKDVWTFARVMGSDDPNWQLVATGE